MSSLYGTFALFNTSAKPTEIDVAADAEAKNPAKVIPTCIVDNSLFGSFRISLNNIAFLFPSSAKMFILVLFNDTVLFLQMRKKH